MAWKMIVSLFCTLMSMGWILYAGPAAPLEVQLVQPDGSKFWARPWGDEWNNGYETLDGYPIVQDASGWWVYAIPGPSGELLPSATPASEKPPVGATVAIKRLGVARPALNRGPGEPTDVPFRVPPNSGTHRALVLLVEFANQTLVGTNEAFWANLIFGTGPWTVRHYYWQVSYWGVSNAPRQIDLVPAPESYGTANNGVVKVQLSYNHPNTQGDTGNANRKIVRDALIAADPYVNFAAFDDDGDGYISTDELHIIVVVAGYECSYGGTASAKTPNVWAHRWSLGFAYQGEMVQAPRLDNKYVCHFSGGPSGTTGGYVQVGEWHALSGKTGHPATIGQICHELGHDLGSGAPDLYDTTGQTNGVGYWCLMGSGAWNMSGATDGEGYYLSGDRPAHPSAWIKLFLGFSQLGHTSFWGGAWQDVSIRPVESGYRELCLMGPRPLASWEPGDPGDGEYFLLEYRGNNGYDAFLPGHGLLIWHIYEGAKDNTYAPYPLVSLEQADGNGDLENKRNKGDAGDPFPGSTGKRTFNKFTIPSSRFWNGKASGVCVTKIGNPTTSEIRVTLKWGPLHTIGTYNKGTGTFYLKNSLSGGAADVTIRFGPVSPGNIIPLSGDWNRDRFDTIGVYDARTGTFYLKNTLSGGAADVTIRFGPVSPGNIIPLVGDWNGDGYRDGIGVYDARTGTFYLRYTSSGGAADVTIRFGPVSPGNIIPLVGDWNVDFRETIGVYDARTGTFYLKNTLSGGAADITIRYGPVSPGNIIPLAGDWDGDGRYTIGVYDARTGTFYLKNTLSGGAADISIRFGPVSPGNIVPLTDDWEGFGPWTPPSSGTASEGMASEGAQPAGFAEGALRVINSPNPVRDVNTTRFVVQSTDPGMVVEAIRVEIFDLAGRLVYDSGWQPNGFEYHIVNNAGEVLPNGVYFYRVRARVNGQEVVLKGYHKLAILR